jgi:hypothetical protein
VVIVVGARRLFSLALVGGLAWWFVGRRREAGQRSATIGYADGSSVTLEPGSPGLGRLLQIAAEATTA